MNIPNTLKKQSPVTEKVFQDFLLQNVFSLPADLQGFYKESNGAEGALGESGYIQIWPIETLVKRNENLNVASNLPGALIFASNGGSFNYGYHVNFGYFMVDPISWSEDLFVGGKTLEELFDLIGKGVLIRRQ
jgi:hypothetical protein